MTQPLITATQIRFESPTLPTDPATKQYVDNVAAGLAAKPAVRAATLFNLSATYFNGPTNNGVGATLTSTVSQSLVIDGITLIIGEGVLIKNQTSSLQNGRYVVTDGGSGATPWILRRCGLCDEADEIPGAYTFVYDGTQEGTAWVQTVNDPITFVVGVDAINVVQVGGGGGGFVLKTGDTMTGNLTLPLTSPASAQDATPRSYVDAADASLTSNITSRVSKAGDSMSGFLTLNADPSVGLHAATKQYVDLAVAGVGGAFVLKTGDTMTGTLTGPRFTSNQSNNGFYFHGGGESIISSGAFDIQLRTAGNVTRLTVNNGGQVNIADNLVIGTTLSAASNRLTVAANGDITTHRGDATGVIFLGNTGARYVFYDGTTYQMPFANLFVNGSQAVTNNGGSWNIIAANTNSIANAVGLAYTWVNTQSFLFNGNHSMPNGYLLQTFSTGGAGTGLSFHRGGNFGLNMALDSDNVFRIGGWSAAANRLQMDMSGNLTMAGNVAAFSDIRLKADLRVIDDALDKVSRLVGYTYTRTDSGERQTGLSAQDVQAVLPEAVMTANDELGTLSVAYGNMTGLIVEAVKELKNEITMIKSRLDVLEQK